MLWGWKKNPAASCPREEKEEKEEEKLFCDGWEEFSPAEGAELPASLIIQPAS